MYYIKIGDAFEEIEEVVKLTKDHFVVKNTPLNKYRINCVKNTLEVLRVDKDYTNIKRFFKLAVNYDDTEIDVMLGIQL